MPQEYECGKEAMGMVRFGSSLETGLEGSEGDEKDASKRVWCGKRGRADGEMQLVTEYYISIIERSVLCMC